MLRRHACRSLAAPGCARGIHRAGYRCSGCASAAKHRMHASRCPCQPSLLAPWPPDFARCRQVCDVLRLDGELVLLIKPQFEAGKEQASGCVGDAGAAAAW